MAYIFCMALVIWYGSWAFVLANVEDTCHMFIGLCRYVGVLVVHFCPERYGRPCHATGIV